MSSYDYKVVQLPANIRPDRVGLHVQDLIDKRSAMGWEFMRIDSVMIEVPPGCIGGLFGHKVTAQTWNVAVFRRRA